MKYLVRFQSGELFDIFELDERSVEGVTGSMWWKMYPNYGEKYSRRARNPTSYKKTGISTQKQILTRILLNNI
jgi:hypothetical protein